MNQVNARSRGAMESSAESQRMPGDVETGIAGRAEDDPPARAPWEQEEEEEKAAYRYLLHEMDQLEDRTWSGATKFLVTLEAVLVLGLTAALVCTQTLEGVKHIELLKMRLWQYVLMAITLFAGLSIVRFLTMIIFYHLINCHLNIHRNWGYFLRGMKRSIDVTVWFSGVLFLWYLWFRPQVRDLKGDLSTVVSHQLTRVLIAACLGAVLWVGKNALFFWLEADLHYRKLADRITRTFRQLHVLKILHQDKPNPGKYKYGNSICKELLLVNKDRVPVWILLRLSEEYRKEIGTNPLPIRKEMMQHPDELLTQALKLFRQVKGKNNTDDIYFDAEELTFADLQEKFQVDRQDLELFFKTISGEKVRPVNLEHRPKTRPCGSFSLSNAVRKCFGGQPAKPTEVAAQNLPTTGECDLRVPTTEECDLRVPIIEECDLRLPIIDECDLRGPIIEECDLRVPTIEECDLRIGRDDFVSWAVVAYRNCLGLQRTLKSSEEIIVKLNRVMIAFVLILVLIIWLLLTEVVDAGQIALLFSPLIAAKFIFSESTKNMFDGLIFALAMHPFSPGDRIIIKTMELLVTEISILSTTFYNYQTGEELVYPNSELATIQIINLEHNPDQKDQLEFFINKKIASEDIRDLEIQIEMALDERLDAFKTNVVKSEMQLENVKMIAHFSYVGSHLTSKMTAYNKSEMQSTIMLLLKTVEPSSKDREAKPYIVDVTLATSVKKAKHLDTIKEAVTKSLKRKGCPYGDDFKVVFSSLKKNKVRLIFWVWKDNHQKISVTNLDEHCQSIYGFLTEKPDPPKESNFKVTQVKVQPTACTIKIEEPAAGDMDDNTRGLSPEDRKTLALNKITKKLKKYYYLYDFHDIEVDKELGLYEIHAWIQFPYNMNDWDEKQQLDMEEAFKDLKKLPDQLKRIAKFTVTGCKKFPDSTNSTS